MLQKNKSQRIALVKYGLSAPLFGLMLVLSSATINNSKTIHLINNKAEQVFLAPAGIQNPKTAAVTTDPNALLKPKTKNKPIRLDTVFEGKVFVAVEQIPTFPGGMDAFYHFLARNITYPAMMKEKGIQGREIISFIVEQEGSLSNIKAVRSIDPAADAESIRVMGLSPKWNPGLQNGKTVRVAYSVPISFTLEGSKPGKHPVK